MSDLAKIRSRFELATTSIGSKRKGGSGGNRGNEPPMDNSEELRDVQKRVTHIEATVPTLATKADVQEVRTEIHEVKADLIKWIVGTAIGLGAVGITVMTFVLNSAVPKSAQQSQQPIIINIPTAPTSPPPPTLPSQPK